MLLIGESNFHLPFLLPTIEKFNLSRAHTQFELNSRAYLIRTRICRSNLLHHVSRTYSNLKRIVTEISSQVAPYYNERTFNVSI